MKSKSILIQTDEASTNQTRPVLTNLNSSTFGSKRFSFANDYDKDERSYSKGAVGTFKNKNLVYAENNFGVNRMFETSLSKYLNDSGKEKKSKQILGAALVTGLGVAAGIGVPGSIGQLPNGAGGMNFPTPAGVDAATKLRNLISGG